MRLESDPYVGDVYAELPIPGNPLQSGYAEVLTGSILPLIPPCHTNKQPFVSVEAPCGIRICPAPPHQYMERRGYRSSHSHRAPTW